MWKYRTATINGLCIDCYTHVQPEFWWQIFRFRNSVNCYWNLCVTVLFFEWLCGSVLWAAAFLWTLFKLIVKNVFSSTSAFRKPVYWWLFWSTFSYRNDCVLCSRCIFPSIQKYSKYISTPASSIEWILSCSAETDVVRCTRHSWVTVLIFSPSRTNKKTFSLVYLVCSITRYIYYYVLEPQDVLKCWICFILSRRWESRAPSFLLFFLTGWWVSWWEMTFLLKEREAEERMEG